MTSGASLFSRLRRAYQDGTLPVKVLNRLSKDRYVFEPSIERTVARAKLPEQWDSWSRSHRDIWTRFHHAIDEYDVQTIVCVGAHNGSIAMLIDETFPGRQFVLLEPVPSTYQIMAANVANRSNFRAANVAVGAEETPQAMYVDESTASSSLLAYEPVALQEFPFLGRQSTAMVQVRRLDDILRDFGIARMDMMLMDVQGYEDRVLRGAGAALEKCRVVVSELSLQPMYVGSSTFDSVYQALVNQGFVLKYLDTPMMGGSHFILQIDGIFVRASGL